MLEQMHCDYNRNKKLYRVPTRLYPHHIYIFGHSLDITDGDILRDAIQTDGVETTIFYRNKQQQANQIANLSKVLTQEELIKRTCSTTPSIIFKKQAEMVPIN